MLIAQISDTHITVPGVWAYGVAPMAENLSRCVEHVNQFVPRSDLVLVTGDISQGGPYSFDDSAQPGNSINVNLKEE